MISKPTARLSPSTGAQGRVLRVRHLWRIAAVLALTLWPLADTDVASSQPGIEPGWVNVGGNDWVYASEELTLTLTPAYQQIPFTFAVPAPPAGPRTPWAFGFYATGNSPWGDVGYAGGWRTLNRLHITGNSGGRISARAGGLTEYGIQNGMTIDDICPGGVPGNCNLNFYYDPPGYQITVRLYIYYEIVATTPTPTPTPTPTNSYATPFPVVQACIPGNQVAGPTPTLAPRTPTPFGTRTPGPTVTPTATGTPGPTATLAPLGFNLLAQFSDTLSPWTSNGAPVVTQSNEYNGPNSQPGIAFLPFDDAPTASTPGPLQEPNITPNGNLLVFERLNMPRTIRLVADVQWPAMMSGQYAYLQVFYWPDSGWGTSPWVLAANIRVNVAWHTVTTLITVPTNQYLPRAIALRAVVGTVPIDNPLGFFPMAASGQGVHVDNLRITGGTDANNPLAVGLPVCAGTGGERTPTPPQTKMCYITVIQTDVYSTCKAPETILEVGLWVNWLVCRVSRYFQFLKENRAQIDVINNRQRGNQPIGPLLEVPAVVDIAYQIVADIARVNAATDYRSLDWRTFVNWQAFDGDPFIVPMPNPNALDEANFACELGLKNVPPNMYRGACFAVNVVRTKTPILPLLQWMLDIGALLGVILYLKNTWMSRND